MERIRKFVYANNGHICKKFESVYDIPEGWKRGYLVDRNSTLDANGTDLGSVLTKEFLETAAKTTPNKEIAKHIGCSVSAVRKYLKKFNISCYNPTNRGRIAPNKKFEVKRGNRYLNRDNEDGSLRRRYHNVFERETGHHIDCSNEVIHHLDFNPSNDVIENLVLMQKCDHDRLHLILRNKHLTGCTLGQVIDLLFKERATDEMKRYADLTRIIPNEEA